MLAQCASALNDVVHWGNVFDAEWRLVFVSDEALQILPYLHSFVGEFHWGDRPGSPFRSLGRSTEEVRRDQFRHHFNDIVRSIPRGREELRTKVAPFLVDLVDELPENDDLLAHSELRSSSAWGIDHSQWTMSMPIRDSNGRLVGFVSISKPNAGMTAMNMLSGGGDTRHLDRIYALSESDRKPAAILFADLEASSSLSRRLSTSDYFNLARRLVRAADESVVQAGGIVGRHLGDGVTAFFLAETLGTESAAARACIEASRSLREAAAGIAERSQLDPAELILRFGLHWGSTLYVGLFKSIARAEVTAMGDEVNEAARIEACASGGRTLASKELIERLSKADAAAFEIDRVSYTTLGALSPATDKARRDAPSISVCEI